MVQLWGMGPRGGLGAGVPRDMSVAPLGTGTHREAGQPSDAASYSCGQAPIRSHHPHPGCTRTGLGRRPPRRCSQLWRERPVRPHRDPAEQLVPPQKPCQDDVLLPQKYRGTPGIPPCAPVSKGMVLSAANPPSLPLSSPTSETSWQVSVPREVSAAGAGCSSQLCFPGASHQTRGFSQETGTRMRRSHEDLQEPRGSCKNPALTSAVHL